MQSKDLNILSIVLGLLEKAITAEKFSQSWGYIADAMSIIEKMLKERY